MKSGDVAGAGSTRKLNDHNATNLQNQISLTKNKAKIIIKSLQNKIIKLQKQLINNKIFLNMVIHDMRNPTNSIEFAVKEVLKLLTQGSGTSMAYQKEDSMINPIPSWK